MYSEVGCIIIKKRFGTDLVIQTCSRKFQTVKLMKLEHTYKIFVEWSGTVPAERGDLQTQHEFSLFYKVSEHTLSKWKRRPEFWEEVDKLRTPWIKAKKSEVLYALAEKAAKTGNAAEVKLWLQYAEGWQEKSKIETTTTPFSEMLQQIREENKEPLVKTDSNNNGTI